MQGHTYHVLDNGFLKKDFIDANEFEKVCQYILS